MLQKEDSKYMDTFQNILDVLGPYYTAVIRWVFVLLAIFILVKSIKSLLQAKNPSEIWAYIGGPDGSSTPLKHWENVIGRASSADIVVNLNSVSRNHGTLYGMKTGTGATKIFNPKTDPISTE